MLWRTTLVYGLSGLFGPMLWFVIPFPFLSDQITAIDYIAYHVVLILWPSGPLGIMEASPGKAPTLAVGSNVTIFAILGLFVGLTRGVLSFVSIAIVPGLLILWWIWLGAVQPSTSHLVAALTSAVLLMLPFFVLRSYYRR
jgi:hypothetical protein